MKMNENENEDVFSYDLEVNVMYGISLTCELQHAIIDDE